MKHELKYIVNMSIVSLIGYLLGDKFILKVLYRYVSIYNNISVKKYFLDFVCHFDFPSLLSFSDFLLTENIKHTVDYITIDNCNELKDPILVFCNNEKEYDCNIVTCVSNGNVFYYDYKNIYHVENTDSFFNANHVYLKINREAVNKNIFKCKKTFLVIRVGVILVPLLLSILFNVNIFILSNMNWILCFINNVLGVYISLMILLLNFTDDSGFLYKMCYINKFFDCKKVTSSFNIYFEKILPMIVLAYFLSNVFYIKEAFSSFYTAIFIHIIAFVFALILLLRQFFVIKKFCFFCVLISIFVFINLFFVYINTQIYYCFLLFVHYVLIFLLFATFIFTINYFLKILNTWILYKRKVDSFVKNKYLFDAILPSFVKYNVSNIGFELGNFESFSHITIVISLSCEYCRNMFDDFVLLYSNDKEIHYRIVLIMRENCGNIYQELKDIYKKCDAGFFVDYLRKLMNDNNYICNKDCCDELVSQTEQIKSMDIKHVPAIFYNEYLLPSEYSLKDLYYLIRE